MSNYVLDKSYKVLPEDGIGAGLAVVRGAAAGECDLPAAANAGAVLGITTHAQPRQNRFISVRRLGIAGAVAAGPIDLGAPVCVADDTGRIAQAATPWFAIGSVGANSAVRIDWTDPGSFALVTTVNFLNDGADQEFGWLVENGSLVIMLPTGGGGAVSVTAAQLIALINADATLGRVLRASNHSTSNGSGTAADGTAAATDAGAATSVIGRAEQAAAAEGDIIDVFLLPA